MTIAQTQYSHLLYTLVAAIAAITSGLVEDPLFAEETAVQRGARQETTERTQKAIKRIQEIDLELVEDKDSADVLYEMRGDFSFSLGNYKEAFGDYTKAINASRGIPRDVLAKRAGVSLQTGDHVQAAADAQKARDGASNAFPFAALALIQAKSTDPRVKDSEAALINAEAATYMRIQESERPFVERALAAAHAANANFKVAIKHQEEAIKLSKERVPEELKSELQAYKEGKLMPFPVLAKGGGKEEINRK